MLRNASIIATFLLLPCIATAQELTFALVASDINEPSFLLAREGCREAAEQLDDVECHYLAPSEPSLAVQSDIVSDLVVRRIANETLDTVSLRCWQGVRCNVYGVGGRSGVG